MSWHQITYHEALKKLNVDPETGLSAAEAKKRKIHYGKNILTEEKNRSFFKKLLAQFSDFMVIMLIAAAVISFVTSFFSRNCDYIDSIIILGIVIINTIIGVLQESRAEKAIESLKRLATPLTKVLRNGKKQRIPSEDVVPGDILILETGDLICADARIIKSSNLAAEESALTGESFAAEKSENHTFNEGTPLADQKNMLFAGGVINRGRAKAAAVATGMNTEVGKIAAMINREDTPETPLQARLSTTGKITSICIIIISIIVFVLGIVQNVDFMEMFMISISLAVAAVPEGLPAVVTIVLANGVRRMAKHNTIVRRLPAVETLGHATVICSDKTGTLTLNKMTVTEIRSAQKPEDLRGHFSHEILTLGVLCNNSSESKSQGETVAQGEPTENALLMAALKCGINKKMLDGEFKRTDEIPFDSQRKLMTTVHNYGGKKYKIITKGAPDVILKICTHYHTENGINPINSTVKNQIETSVNKMASEALRVIAIAYRDETSCPGVSSLESNLVFLGMVGIMDPPRPEAKRAVEECRGAGVRPVMITGDHLETAKAIAQKLGILTKNSKSITGEELNSLSQEKLEKDVCSYSVFARVSPEHKVRIVKALQANNEIVAMTGDGVNDAPALKAANIGCAMGKSGTDAAKAASDMIMADDNFATIVEAVRQGRGMFENIKKTVHFLISTNIGEVMVVLLGFLIRIPAPLLAIHLLWINLVTDAFPAIALGMEPLDSSLMKRPPRDPRGSLFSRTLIYNIVVEGCFIAAVGLLSFSIGRVFFDLDSANPVIGRTMAFVTLGLSQVIHAFNVQSRKSLFITGFLSNLKLVYAVILCAFLQTVVVTLPSLRSFFKTQPLNFIQWMIVIGLALMPLLISEIEKYLSMKGTYIYKMRKSK